MKTILTLSVLIVTGCVSVQSTTITNLSRSQGQRYTASDYDSGFLYVYAPSIEAISERVLAKFNMACDKGNLVNVQTTLMKRDFLFVQNYFVDVTAVCTSH